MKIEKLKNSAGVKFYPVTIPEAIVNEETNELLPVTLAKKAEHGYESSPKTLKEVDDSVAQLANDKVDIDFLGEELNVIKPLTQLVYGERISTTGYIITGYDGYRTKPKPVIVGERYAAIHGIAGNNPIFSFFNSNVIGTASFVSQIVANEAVVPSGATFMVIHYPTVIADVLIVMQMDSGFPVLGQDTFIYNDLAKKNELALKADHGYYKSPKTLKQVDDELSINKLNIDDIGVELNLIKKGVMEEMRINPTSREPEDNTLNFITYPQQVVEGEVYTSVSPSVGQVFSFFFYNSSVLDLSSFISAATGRTVSVPAGATYMVVQYLMQYIDDSIVVDASKIETIYPSLGQSTLVLPEIYGKEEIDLKLASLPEWYGEETNILKKATTILIDGSRTDNSGNILSDTNYFRTNLIPVVAGERYAAASLNPNPLYFYRFSFYSKKEIISNNFIALTEALDAIVPAGAEYMVFASSLSYKSSTVLQKLAEGFPILGAETIVLKDTYTQRQLDEKISLIESDISKWYPDVFDIEVISEQRNEMVLVIKNDVLYGSDRFRDIFKATKVDLSDKLIVCTLPSNTTLRKLMFVSEDKAVGYVDGVGPDIGFYCFDNADTDVWSARKVGQMLAGSPSYSFQSMIKTPDSQYLFAISYGTKVTDPLDTTTEAPRHIYRSIDLGETWQVVYTHHERLNTHMHAIEYDIFRNRVWCAIGDYGAGGDPGWAYSDDYGDTWTFVSGHMDTAILPTRKYVLFGSDSHPARFDKWEPAQDIKNAIVTNDDVEILYKIPVEQTENFGFARNPAIDTSVYPYRIAVAFAHTAEYSKSCILLSPNYKIWYMMDLANNPNPDLWWDGISGITSDGWVLGYCGTEAGSYYRRFKFPNWIEN